MANKTLKIIAIAAGTGLAFGLGNNRSRSVVPASLDVNPAFESQLDRLDRFEARLKMMEDRSAESPESISFAELNRRLAEQTKDIAALQSQMTQMRQKIAAVATIVENRFAEVANEVPAMLESVLTQRVADVRARLDSEIRGTVNATLETFEQTIDQRISVRIVPVENALIEQSGVVTALSQRAIESDGNLQRLISAVEKLCERTEAARPRDPSILDSPFDRHLTDAINRQPEASAQPASSGFWPGIVQDDTEKRRPRHSLTSL